MPAQIMGAEVNADQHPGFCHHGSGRLIGNRENPLLADALRVRFVAFGEFVQEVQGMIGRDLINLEVFEMQTQLICNELICPDAIFFRMGSVVIDPDFYGFG